MALPILGGPEDPLAEQTVALRLEGAVVEGLRLLDPPLDQARISSGEAIPMRIRSKLLTSSNKIDSLLWEV